VEGRQSISYSGQGFSPRGEKGRFVLPPQFRKTVRESSDGARVLCLGTHERWRCLTGFGLSRKEDLLAQVEREEMLAAQQNKDFDRDMRLGQLFGFSEVPFDDSGRFVIPDHFAALAGLEDSLFFQAHGTFFTLWNPAELARMGPGWEGAQAACAHLSADGKGRK
jgi:MraZ protein